jgi:hypothetical protein
MRLLAISISTLAAGFLPFSAALAQSPLPGLTGMAMDPPPTLSDPSIGMLRAMPAEPPIADPSATALSATIMDVGNQGTSRTLVRPAEPQPLPEEPNRP